MNETGWALFGGLLLTGLAGSLHCVGMCGPVLLGLSRRLPEGRSFAVDALAYHLGRIWTYMLLGLLAGAFGQRLHRAMGAGRTYLLVLGLVALVVTVVIDAVLFIVGARYHHFTKLLLGVVQTFNECRGMRVDVQEANGEIVHVAIS